MSSKPSHQHNGHSSHPSHTSHQNHGGGNGHHAAHTAHRSHAADADKGDDGHDSVLRPPAKASHHKPERADETKAAAVDLIRQKLDAIYAEDTGNSGGSDTTNTSRAGQAKTADYVLEPAAQAEIAEVDRLRSGRSKHQQFMYDLHNSGKGMAAIQTAWHQYYLGLPDDEKREVWQEFYSTASSKANDQAGPAITTTTASTTPQPAVSAHPKPDLTQIYPTPTRTPEPNLAPVYQADDGGTPPAETARDSASNPLQAPSPSDTPDTKASLTAADRVATNAIRDKIRSRVGSRTQLKVKHHVQSLLFGLGFGGLVVLIVLFSFFNEVVIAPFIQPSRSVSATPIIVGTGGVAATGKNEVLIPKINLEIPLDFSAKTIDEKEIETGLDNGVVHYPTTSLPGQQGNAAFFGHSSNNIFNPGKYKFAFVLLHELEPGDTFYLSYNGTMYAYQVFDKKIVEPTDVGVLNPVAGKSATATLITCDPPGTSLRRLVVWGEQVSPNPSANAVAAPTPTTSGAEQALPGNGPTLWRRLLNAISGN